MIDKIMKLLEKYENRIMLNTLGNYVDEDNERYAEIYKYEWKNHRDSIAYILNRLSNYGETINPIGFAYIIINEWAGVMTFREGALDIKELTKVCEDILIDLDKINSKKSKF